MSPGRQWGWGRGEGPGTPALHAARSGNSGSLVPRPPRLWSLVSRSVLGRRCRDLLVHLYLQRPDLRVPVPDVLLHSEGAAGSSVCKVKPCGVIGPPLSFTWR